MIIIMGRQELERPAKERLQKKKKKKKKKKNGENRPKSTLNPHPINNNLKLASLQSLQGSNSQKILCPKSKNKQNKNYI
jgi:hypothetical protein